MRICLLYQGADLERSERLEKMVKSLTGAGHSVYVLCNQYESSGIRQETMWTATVIRLRPTFRSRRLNRILKFPIFCNPLWTARLAAIIRKHRIEALQVVDIPLAPAAIRAGRRFQIPVVLDMWENYPEALRLWAQTDWTTLVFKNYRVARAVERYVVKRVDHIFTVVEEQKERLQAEGIPKERISVVTNAVDLELFLRTPVRNDTPLDAEPAAFKLLYVGKLTSERGLDDMIQACALVRPMVPAVRLYIAGTGNDEPRLRTIAARHGVAGHIHFLGWVSFEDIHSYILKSDLCLVPHVYSDFINTTIPNKLFQYMALAKPVLVSNARPLARIVTESGCGYTFQSGDPADAARKIVDAYQARSSREHGERGSRYVREHYTWEKVAPALLRVYEQLESQRPAAAGAGR